MKPFRFGAQPLLDWKRRQAERLEAALAEAETARARSDQRAAEADRAGEDVRSAAVAEERIDPEELRRASGWAESLTEQAAAARAESRRLAAEAARARSEGALLRREIRALEKLRRRRLDEWRRASEREVENQASELFLLRRPRG